MDPDLLVYELAHDHLVLELHERFTAPGPALELHVVQDSQTGRTRAWWEDDAGRWVRAAMIGTG